MAENAGLNNASKAQAAEFFGISLPTLDKWIRDGAPIKQRGGRGISWCIDLRSVAEWKYGRRERLGDGTIDPEDLEPADRKAWYEGEAKRRALEIQDRDLYQRGEVLSVLTTTVAVFAEQMRSLPDKLEREAGITGSQAEVAERVIDSQLNDLRDKIMEAVDG